METCSSGNPKYKYDPERKDVFVITKHAVGLYSSMGRFLMSEGNISRIPSTFSFFGSAVVQTVILTQTLKHFIED